MSVGSPDRKGAEEAHCPNQCKDRKKYPANQNEAFIQQSHSEAGWLKGVNVSPPGHIPDIDTESPANHIHRSGTVPRSLSCGLSAFVSSGATTSPGEQPSEVQSSHPTTSPRSSKASNFYRRQTTVLVLF